MSKISAPRNSKATISGASLVIISSFFYGMYGVWARLMGNSFGSYIQNTFRCSLVVLFLLPFAIYHKQLSRVHWRRDARLLLLALTTSIFTGPFLYYSAVHSGIGLATAISYAGILVSMIVLGMIVNKEKHGRGTAISVLLALIGLYCIFSPSIKSFGILALGAAFISGAAAGTNVLVSQHLKYNTTQTIIINWSTGILVNLAIALLIHDKVPSVHNHAWLFLVLFALTSVAASWCVVRASKMISIGVVGILGLLEIVFGVLFGVIFFAERPSLIALLGMAFIVAAAALPYVAERRVRHEVLD